MEKTQDVSQRRKKWFKVGVILIFSSSAGGWIGGFILAALSAKFGPIWLVIAGVWYALSWIPFGLGFLLAGPAGVAYVKGIFRRIFRAKG